MSHRRVAIALLLLMVAVLVQTTVFAQVRPFRVAPDLVLLVVIAALPFLEPEQGVFLGFTGGVVVDLLGSTPAGLRALVLTLVAFVAVRVQHRYEGNFIATAVAVLGLSFLGVALLSLVGTLFGQTALVGTDVVRRLVLIPLYNLVLAVVVLPVVSRLLETRRRSRSLL